MALSDDIKARLDIVDVVSDYVPDLRKSGRNFTARCPFHQERTPSFVVFPERQTWRCFGACATGGDVFTFVMKTENLEFSGALKQLAQRAGISIPERRRQEQTPRNPLLAVNDRALEFFREALTAERGSMARDYLGRRGLRDETVVRFGLGYSPSTGDELLRHMQSVGVGTDQLLAAGLAVQSEDGTVRDMFRGRLTFAIRDATGSVVGFAGRALDDSLPKYLNTPQTVLFDKGRLLYGLDLATADLAQQGQAVVVEGYTDVIAAHEHGYRNVVASMGTALTEFQVRLLKEHADAFVLALDPDTAGQEATLRSLKTNWDVLGRQEVTGVRRRPGPGLFQRPDDLQALRVAVLPVGQDPDDLIRQSPDRWLELIRDAVSVVDYLFSEEARRTDVTSSQGKLALVQELYPLITAMQNPYDQDRYLQRLADLAGVSRDTLQASVGRPRPGTPTRRRAQPAGPPASSTPFLQAEIDPLEEYVLTLMVQDPHLLARAGELSHDHLRRHENRVLLSAIQEAGTIGIDNVKSAPELGEHLDRLEARELPPADRGQRTADFEACLRRLEERHLRELKSQEEAVLAQPAGEHPIQDTQITAVNQRLKELFTGESR